MMTFSGLKQSLVILRCERSEPRRMGHGPYSSFEARKSAHLRMTVTPIQPKAITV
jgi:hypothetical protein